MPGDLKVHNRDFIGPDRLGKLPCVVCSRFLEKVDEKVIILNVCQDEQNPSVVWITFSLNGVFNYTPKLNIFRVDEDGSYKNSNITAPIFLSYYRNTVNSLPINTNCQTKTYILAFDFGSVIPNFLGCNVVEFELVMDGIMPENLNIPDFAELTKTIRDINVWTKGPTPNPYRLVYSSNNEKLFIYFDFNDNIPCKCNIECASISGNINTIQYCPDKISRITVDYAQGDDPQSILLRFSDTIGNFKTLDIYPLIGTTPMTPIISALANPKRIEINIDKKSLNGSSVGDKVAYQIWKYNSSISSAFIWKDWSYRDHTTFVDMDVIPGNTYGYALRLRGPFGDESKISNWASKTIPL
jgi:hypothetical protein